MIDPERVAAIMRETAAAEIAPRFRALAATDVREKRPGDLVTVADIEAERRLVRELEAAAPGTVAFGEEGVAADPAKLELLAGTRPVWVIDPVDGTGNFAKGIAGFAMMVAYLEDGVTLAGWIYDPQGNRLVWARRGGGAWYGTARLAITAETVPERLVGSAYGRTAAGIRTAKALTDSGLIAGVRNRGCSGLEYIDIALGAADFSLHSRSLPWDHAAGMLIAAEAGGAARFLDGSAYDARIPDRPVLAASSEFAWRFIRDFAAA